MKSYQSNINEQIKDDVDRVNKIGNRIYELNLQIQKVEAGGQETAMTLRDEVTICWMSWADTEVSPLRKMRRDLRM